METFITEIMGDLLTGSSEIARVDKTGWHDSEAGEGTNIDKFINWLTISDNDISVVEDVPRIRGNSMAPSSIQIYDCKTGALSAMNTCSSPSAKWPVFKI